MLERWHLFVGSGLRQLLSEGVMSNVTNIRHVIPVSREMDQAITDLDVAICDAIEKAKGIGLPQGFVVSILQGHAHKETHLMVRE